MDLEVGKKFICAGYVSLGHTNMQTSQYKLCDTMYPIPHAYPSSWRIG